MPTNTISSHSRLKCELADVKRRLEGVLQAVENGAWNNSVQTRLTELEVRQTTLEAKIAAGETEEVPIALHPNAAEIYKRKVTELEAARTDPDVCSEAGEALAVRPHVRSCRVAEPVACRPHGVAAWGRPPSMLGDD